MKRNLVLALALAAVPFVTAQTQPSSPTAATG